MNKQDIKKVVLAYSGGLDTSIIIPWLKENYNNCEVIAVSGNVGQADELEGLEEKALKTGASKLYVLDLTDDYVDNYGTISDPDWVEEHWTQTSVGELIVSGMCEADKMQVIAAALNDLDARLKAVEESISSVNIGSRIADEIDTQSLKVGGEDINDIIQNAIGG